MDEKTCDQYRKTLDYFKKSSQIENRDYFVLENEINNFNKSKTKKQVIHLQIDLLISLVNCVSNFGKRKQSD